MEDTKFEHDTLVVSSGGIRGVSMLGALHYCHVNYYLKSIKTYVGTSVGALICYFLCIGYTPLELFTTLMSMNVFHTINNNIRLDGVITGDGLLDFSVIQAIIEKITIEKIAYFPTFKDILTRYNKRLVISTFNINKNDIEYFTPETHPDVPCITALRMSCSIPFVFEKFKYLNNYYIDGAVTDEFSIRRAKEEGKHLLGVYISSASSYGLDVTSMSNISYLLYLLTMRQSRLLKHDLDEIQGDFIEIVDNNFMLNFSVNTTERLNMFSNGFNKAKTCFESV